MTIIIILIVSIKILKELLVKKDHVTYYIINDKEISIDLDIIEKNIKKKLCYSNCVVEYDILNAQENIGILNVIILIYVI